MSAPSTLNSGYQCGESIPCCCDDLNQAFYNINLVIKWY